MPRLRRIVFALISLTVISSLANAEIVVPSAAQRAEGAKIADAVKEAELRSAIAAGGTHALFDLAELLRNRETTPAKSPEMHDLLVRSAAARDWRALRALGLQAAADEVLRQSSDAGDVEAINRLAADAVETTDAIALYRKAADRGDPYAMYHLALLLMNPEKRLGSDPEMGRMWLRAAANAGNLDALFCMAHERVFQKPWPANGEASLKWYHRAANAGSAEAMRRIAAMYRDGAMIRQNTELAIEWYQRAAVADGRGLASIGDMFRGDDAAAMKWYRAAAAAGEATGMYELGVRYERGEGVKRDLDEAKRWYDQAANAGSEDAERTLAAMGAERLPREFNNKLGEILVPASNLGGDIIFFHQATRRSIYVDWRSLKDVGIDKDTPVDLRLDDVRVIDALRRCIEIAGSGKLTFAVVDGIVIISTPSGIASRAAAHKRHFQQKPGALLEKRLVAILPGVDFSEVGLADALDFIRDVGGVTFNVDWNALRRVGVDTNSPVSFNANNIKMQSVFELILFSAGGSAELDYHIRDGVIVILPRE